MPWFRTTLSYPNIFNVCTICGMHALDMTSLTLASFTVNCYYVLFILTHPFTDTGSEFQHVPR